MNDKHFPMLAKYIGDNYIKDKPFIVLFTDYTNGYVAYSIDDYNWGFKIGSYDTNWRVVFNHEDWEILNRLDSIVCLL